MRSIRNVSCAVIGGAGFLGSHCVDHLVNDRKCKVLVIDNLVAGRREFVHKDAEFIHHDITGSETYLRRLFEQHEVEYVLNYAAYPYVPDSFARPVHVCDVNFMGALQVINAAQEAGVKGILQVSSAEVFGNQTGSIDENAPVTPHSSYGASKAAIDFMCQVRWREAGTPVLAVRQFNCYGKRPTHYYVIPEIIQQLHKGPIVRLGNNSTRDFQYATNAVETAVNILERGEWGEFYNMGSEESIKIYDLAHLIGELMGHKEIQIEQDPSRVRPWEIWQLKANCNKLYSVAPRKPLVSFRDGLTQTIEWFRQRGGTWGI